MSIFFAAGLEMFQLVCILSFYTCISMVRDNFLFQINFLKIKLKSHFNITKKCLFFHCTVPSICVVVSVCGNWSFSICGYPFQFCISNPPPPAMYLRYKIKLGTTYLPSSARQNDTESHISLIFTCLKLPTTVCVPL